MPAGYTAADAAIATDRRRRGIHLTSRLAHISIFLGVNDFCFVSTCVARLILPFSNGVAVCVCRGRCR